MYGLGTRCYTNVWHFSFIRIVHMYDYIIDVRLQVDQEHIIEILVYVE